MLAPEHPFIPRTAKDNYEFCPYKGADVKQEKMKKLLFSALAVITLSLSNTNICWAKNKIKTTTSTINVSSINRSVDVYKIQGNVRILTPISGDYNSETNMITIKGQSYSVKYNPNYGKTGKTKNYEYYAGGIYYFNL